MALAIVAMIGPIAVSAWWLVDPIWVTHEATFVGIGWVGQSDSWAMPMWGRLLPAVAQIVLWWVGYSYLRKEVQIDWLPALRVPYQGAIGEIVSAARGAVCPRIEYT